MRGSRWPAVAALLGVLAVLGLTVLPAAQAAYDQSSYGSRLVQLVNDERARHGLAALSVAQGTSEVAAAWTDRMVDRQALSHNPDLQAQLESHGSPAWGTYGEAVGRGAADDPDAVVAGYMASDAHREVLLDPAMRFVGVAVRFDGTAAWNTLDLVDCYGSAPPSGKPVQQPAAAPVQQAAAPPQPAAARTAPTRPVPPVARAVAVPRWVTAVPLSPRHRATSRALLARVAPVQRAAVTLSAGPGTPPAIPLSEPVPPPLVVTAAALVGLVGTGVLVSRWLPTRARPCGRR